ncbi:hypothetical protein QBC39DRAFT_362860 [Podospora conica]|nr:hypothetical protein QBC39DRAFT_362860 [Schizothecium conicum]
MLVRACGLSLLSGPRTDDASFGRDLDDAFFGFGPQQMTSLCRWKCTFGRCRRTKRPVPPKGTWLRMAALQERKLLKCRSIYTSIYPPARIYHHENRMNRQIPRHLKRPSRSPFPTSHLEITELTRMALRTANSPPSPRAWTVSKFQTRSKTLAKQQVLANPTQPRHAVRPLVGDLFSCRLTVGGEGDNGRVATHQTASSRHLQTRRREERTVYHRDYCAVLRVLLG